MSAPARPVAHVITGLAVGGAERMLQRLVAAMAPAWAARVISLRDEGPIGIELRERGIPVTAVGFGPLGPRTLGAPLRLRRALRGSPPPVLVQGWMYHGNLAALLGRPYPSVPVVWNVRQSFSGFDAERPGTALMIRLGARWSSRASRIVYNSRVSARQHEAIGYDPARTVIIPNGFDTALWRPRPEARGALRHRLGLPVDAVLVGQVARYHPMKDHRGLLRAAAPSLRARGDVHLLLAGAGVDEANLRLTEEIAALGIAAQVRLLGPWEDVPGLMAGLDICCSPSAWGEGFPNAVGEAMACGVPCIATDVGDSAWVLGEGGVVVPAGAPDAMSGALADLLDRDPEARRALGARGRRRIETTFALAVIAEQYRLLYEMILAGTSAP